MSFNFQMHIHSLCIFPHVILSQHLTEPWPHTSRTLQRAMGSCSPASLKDILYPLSSGTTETCRGSVPTQLRSQQRTNFSGSPARSKSAPRTKRTTRVALQMMATLRHFKFQVWLRFLQRFPPGLQIWIGVELSRQRPELCPFLTYRPHLHLALKYKLYPDTQPDPLELW